MKFCLFTFLDFLIANFHFIDFYYIQCKYNITYIKWNKSLFLFHSTITCNLYKYQLLLNFDLFFFFFHFFLLHSLPLITFLCHIPSLCFRFAQQYCRYVFFDFHLNSVYCFASGYKRTKMTNIKSILLLFQMECLTKKYKYIQTLYYTLHSKHNHT